MPTIIQPTDSVRLSATFIDYDSVTGEEIPVTNPDNVEGSIFKWDGSSWVANGTFTPAPDLEPGVYFHDWVPGSEGLFRIIIEATININTTVTNERQIYVGAFTPSKTLAKDAVYLFIPEVEPFYLDPERVLIYYPDGDLPEIAEKIYRFSKELEWIVGESPIHELTPLMENFLLASVLCELSMIYVFDGGLSGFTQSDMFRLGDLQVQSGSGSGGSSSGNGNGVPTTWCEMAALLKDQLVSGKAGIRWALKGSRWCNPVNDRKLKRYE